MRITFVYPAFERHANSHPELLEFVPCDEYLGSPSLGIANLSAVTPAGIEKRFIDDRVNRFDPDREEADLFAISSFTPGASRAMEIGRALKARGKQVVFGGIFPTQMPDEAQDAVDAVVVGEGEPVWHEILADAQRGKLKPRYQSARPWDTASAGPPDVNLYIDAESPGFAIDDYPLQPCRGCALTCETCTIPSVMGRSYRFFSEETIVRAAQDLNRRNRRFCITEHTLFLPPNRRKFRRFLDALYAQANGAPILISYISISMPMLLNLDEELIHQLVKVGVRRFYLVCGLDRLTLDAFGRGNPKALEDCAEAIRRCHDFGILPYSSFLVGTEADDEGVFDRILEFSDRLGVQTAEFAIQTPYPGTRMWHQFVKEDRLLHRDWRKYNDANVVFKPRAMTPDRLLEGYLYLWRQFYGSRQHLRQAGHTVATVQF